MQDPNGAFWRCGFGFIAGANHQGTDVQIVTLPFFIDRYGKVHPTFRHIDCLPPEWAVAGFDHRIALTGGRGSDMQFNGVTRLVCRLIEF